MFGWSLRLRSCWGSASRCRNLCCKVSFKMRLLENKAVDVFLGSINRTEEELLTLQHQPKLSLRKPLRGSSSVGASATRSFGSSKMCSSGPPRIGPSPFPKKYLRKVERGRFDGVLKPSTCCSRIRAFPAHSKFVSTSTDFTSTHDILS